MGKKIITASSRVTITDFESRKFYQRKCKCMDTHDVILLALKLWQKKVFFEENSNNNNKTLFYASFFFLTVDNTRLCVPHVGSINIGHL